MVLARRPDSARVTPKRPTSGVFRHPPRIPGRHPTKSARHYPTTRRTQPEIAVIGGLQVALDRAARRELLRQHPPLAAPPRHVENRVGVTVGVGDEAVDGSLQVGDGAEHTPLEPASGELDEEVFDGVQAGSVLRIPLTSRIRGRR